MWDIFLCLNFVSIYSNIPYFYSSFDICIVGFETSQFIDQFHWPLEDCRLWSCQSFPERREQAIQSSGCYKVRYCRYALHLELQVKCRNIFNEILLTFISVVPVALNNGLPHYDDVLNTKAVFC